MEFVRFNFLGLTTIEAWTVVTWLQIRQHRNCNCVVNTMLDCVRDAVVFYDSDAVKVTSSENLKVRVLVDF